MPYLRRRRLRFGRRRRRAPIRRLKRVIRRRTNRIKRKQRRRQRAKSYFLGTSNATHLDGPFGAITITPAESVARDQQGLFGWFDAQEIIEQVKNVDDLIYPGMLTQGRKAGRINITVRAKGSITYTMSNTNKAGAVFAEVYVCKPRKGINQRGVGETSTLTAWETLNANKNNAFVTDYNDARAITINAGAPFSINNTQNQTKPTVDDSNYSVTPYMVPPFTENWRVIKQHKFIIPAGGMCMWKIKTPWIRFSRQSYQPIGTADGTNQVNWGIFRPAFGVECFVRFHGQPVHDITAVGPPEVVTTNYGAATLDIVAVKRYWYSHTHRNLPSYLVQTPFNQGNVSGAQLPGDAQQPVDETD